jgi:hypothetical protein
MRSINNWLFRPIAVCLVLWLMFPASEVGTAAAQQAVAEHRTANSVARGSLLWRLASRQRQRSGHSGPVSPQVEPLGAERLAKKVRSTAAALRLVGTAAAPGKTMIAASRPAGAAIAPAKQRRVRTILISVGVIVAAGVAVGTVAGLSHASSSHPQ